jgi:hypothetical protein
MQLIKFRLMNTINTSYSRKILTTFFVTVFLINLLPAQTNFYKSFQVVNHYCGNHYQVIKTFDNGYACPVEDGGILKLDSLAQLQFCTMFSYDSMPQWNAITQTTDSGFIITKTETIPNNTIFGLAAKFDKRGNYLWSKKYFNPSYYGRFLTDIISTNDNGFLLLADIYCSQDIALIRCNADGDIIWQKTYISTAAAWNITKYSETKTLILAIDNYKFVALMIDTSGNQLWSKEYNFTNEDFIPTRPVINSNKEISILMNITSVTPIDKSMLMRIDSTGQIIFGPQIISPNDTGLFKNLYSLCQTNDKGYLYVGGISSFSPQVNNTLYIKVDSLNNIEWARGFGNFSYNDLGTNLGLNVFNTGNFYYMFSQNSDGLSVTKLDQNGYGFCHYDAIGFHTQNAFTNAVNLNINPINANTLAASVSFSSYIPNVDSTIYCSNITDIAQHESFTNIECFPNPTTGNLFIQANKLQRIMIFNIQGKLIHDIPVQNSNTVSIDLSGEPAALYFIKIITDKNVSAKVIIKQ